MRSFIIFLSILTLSAIGNAQTAQEYLNKVEEGFSKLNKAAYSFSLTIEIPEQSDITQTGSLKKEGDKVYATIGDRWIKSDGTNQWVYDPELNEVQIFNASESNALPISPETLTRLYKDGSFEYDITGRGVIENKEVVFIEFKPLDDMSEYVKMRFALTEKDGQPVYFKVFARDANRYTLEINSVDKSPVFDQDIFTFKPSDYPNVTVEDLRL